MCINKKYKCKKLNHDVKIDGELDKDEWQQAEEIVLLDAETGMEPRLKTSVKALWNENYIYFAFKCNDDYVKATKTAYNDKVYEEDVVEVFIDDNRDMKTYIEVEANPFNTVLHYSIKNNLKGCFISFARTEKKIISAVSIEETTNEWTTEIAVPLSEFITAENYPPKPGDKWLVNFYRIDRGQDGVDEYSSWGTTGKINFHMPETFGELIFTQGD